MVAIADEIDDLHAALAAIRVNSIRNAVSVEQGELIAEQIAELDRQTETLSDPQLRARAQADLLRMKQTHSIQSTQLAMVVRMLQLETAVVVLAREVRELKRRLGGPE